MEIPGNPVSAAVTAQLYLLPACRQLAGRQSPLPGVVRARLPAMRRLDPRPEYVRARLTWASAGEAVADTFVPSGCQVSGEDNASFMSIF
jgi:molybdopterin biosynthesis enzyme